MAPKRKAPNKQQQIINLQNKIKILAPVARQGKSDHEKVVRLTGGKARAEAKVKVLNQNINTLNTDYKASQNEVKTLKEQVGNITAEKTGLEGRVTDLNGKLTNANTDLKAKEQQVYGLQGDLKVKAAEADRDVKVLGAQKDGAYETLKAQMEKAVAGKDKDIAVQAAQKDADKAVAIAQKDTEIAGKDKDIAVQAAQKDADKAVTVAQKDAEIAVKAAQADRDLKVQEAQKDGAFKVLEEQKKTVEEKYKEAAKSRTYHRIAAYAGGAATAIALMIGTYFMGKSNAPQPSEIEKKIKQLDKKVDEHKTEGHKPAEAPKTDVKPTDGTKPADAPKTDVKPTDGTKPADTPKTDVKPADATKKYLALEVYVSDKWVEYAGGTPLLDKKYRAVYRNKIGDKEIEYTMSIRADAVAQYLNLVSELESKCPLDPSQIEKLLKKLPLAVVGPEDEIRQDDVLKFLDVYKTKGLEKALEE